MATTVTPYLVMNGAVDAIRFYEQALMPSRPAPSRPARRS
jgi:uncharacterized glyoxalase superfamily protein PhnB